MRLTVAEDSLGKSLENASTWARPFTARLLEPGLVSYADKGCGIALLKKETIDRDIHTFIGRPIVCRKNSRGSLVHEKTSPENMKEVGHGYITEVFFNASDGWWYGRGVVDTDEAAKEINRVGFCSVGYRVTNTGPSGKCHDMPYDEEIKGFSGEHLAVVGNPRYEEATIRLNSKTIKTDTPMRFAFWKKTAARQNSTTEPTAAEKAAAQKLIDDKAPSDAAAARENATDISADSELEITNAEGKPEKVTLKTLVDAFNAKSDGEIDDDDEVTVNGVKVKMNALIGAYTKQCALYDEEKKKRENAAADKAAEDQRKKDAEAAGKGKSRENAPRVDHFRILSTAPSRAPVVAEKHDFETAADRLERGNALYGSSKKN